MERLRMKFSNVEVIELVKAWLAISIAFTILLAPSLLSLGVIKYFIISSLTVGISFLIHELGHKLLAQKYGCWAEFRAFDQMLVLAIIMSFFGFIFAAPGAVFIKGRLNKDKYGKISLFGPLSNIILAIIFLIIKVVSNGLVNEIAGYGLLINAWLAAFNMIPFLNFDGAKIFKWNKAIYFTTLVIAFSLMFVQYFIK